MRKKVGLFSENVVQKLGLEMAVGTPIYVADTNVEHMQKSHPEDYEKFGNELHNIIANPDYVGKNIPTSHNELVAVCLEEFDGKTGVDLYTITE